MEVSDMHGLESPLAGLSNTAPASVPGTRTDDQPQDTKAKAVSAESKPSTEEVQRPARAPTVNSSGVRLHIDESSKQIVAQIVDEDNQVIKQIPPDEALKLAQRARATNGLLFDEEV